MRRGCRSLRQPPRSARRAIHKWGNPMRIVRRVGDCPGPAEPVTIAAECSEAYCVLLIEPTAGGCPLMPWSVDLQPLPTTRSSLAEDDC